MSYPKKSPTAKAIISKSISVDPKRERLLAIQERERVKDQLVNKFAAKYAKDNKVNKVLVNKQVAEFLQNDSKVTEENLKKLEQRISEAVKDRANGNTKGYVAPIETTPNEAVGSLKKIDDDAHSVNSSERPRSVYIQGKGNDEWAAIAKYDTELYRNELLAAKRKEQEQKKNIKAELDRQIAYKKQVQRSEADELKRYVSSVQDQVKQGEEKERKKMQDMHNKILQQKYSRDQQLLDELNKKKQDKKSEKLKDDELVKKLKQEMDQEAKNALAKKTADKEYMKKVFKDNEDYKKQAAIDAKIQKEADIKAQQEYTRLIEKQMAEREAEVKEREERAKKFMSMMADTVVKDQKAQQLEEERKLLKNYADREQREAQEDRRRQALLNDKKQEMRNYLNLQLQEKERKKQEEKELERKQAEIWRQDAEEFRNSEKLKSQKFKESVSKNAEYQKQQIHNSAEKQRKMNNEEALYNKPLLKNIAAKDQQEFVRKTLGKQRI